MITTLWIDHRKDNWNRLDALLRRVESDGIKTLPRDELREFGLLYRQAAADLSTARSDTAARALEDYLNRLVGRAHNYVYSGRRISPASLWHFLAHGYPRLMRRMGGYVLAATAITIFFAMVASLAVSARPKLGAAMLGPEMMAKIEHHQMWTDDLLTAMPQGSSMIMTNNLAVCFYTFATGILAGLGTLYLLAINGMELGVVATVCAQHHMALSLWSFVASHGALELPSIMIAGAAGLRLGTGVLFPGLLRRREAIAVAGRDAVQLVAGIIPLLIVAGTLEGFFSPTRAPMPLKFSVGAVLFVGLCWWFGEGGRKLAEARTAA